MLDAHCEGLVNRMTLVWIVVKDPTDGPKIFNSLNSKQEPMTIGDLVRNEVFSKIFGKPDDYIKMVDENHWRPFYDKFSQGDRTAGEKAFAQYFFPFALTLKNSVKKDGAFNFLRDRWARVDDPIEIIDELSTYQDVYLDLHYGSSDTQGISDLMRKLLNRLHRMKAPSSIYPFVFNVVGAVQKNEIECAEAERILEAIESFLVRRGVCGYEPTGLHAVFKSLWGDCGDHPSVEKMREEIGKHATVAWPEDDQFKSAIISRPLYGAKITPYLLEEWNTHLGGDPVFIDSKQIEHVLPERPKAESAWLKDWSNEDRHEHKDCLANLLPLSQSLNGSIQNSEYPQKRDRYLADSALKAARQFALDYETWRPADFDDRAAKLSEWACERWSL